MPSSAQLVPENRRSLVKQVVTPPFLVAVLLLGAAAGLAGPVASWMNLKQSKRPLPLKKPLPALDEPKLAPFRVLERHVLDPAIVEAMGTDVYLSWTLENTTVPADHPLRFANLLVTYYSGGNSLVPHTPDVCYLGSGYSPARPHETTKLYLSSLPEGLRRVPVRVCTFAKTAIFGHEKATVVYTFHCNGRFLVRPRLVRIRLNTPTNTFAYFSKVEVSFPRATRTESVEGAKQLFDRLLPVLVRDHWPDFQAAEEHADRGGAAHATLTGCSISS